MDYVDWCGRVLAKAVELSDQRTDARIIGVSTQDLGAAFFGSTARTAAFWQSLEREGLLDALRDLIFLGLVTSRDHQYQYCKPTSGARDYIADPVPVWEAICSARPESKQVDLLRAVNRLSPTEDTTYARVGDIDGEVIVAEVAWASDIGLLKSVMQELMDDGYIGGHYSIGTSPASVKKLHATLRGLIWETRRKFTKDSREIDRLVAEWETTSVDFKRDIHLDTKDEEAGDGAKRAIRVAPRRPPPPGSILLRLSRLPGGAGGPPLITG